MTRIVAVNQPDLGPDQAPSGWPSPQSTPPPRSGMGLTSQPQKPLPPTGSAHGPPLGWGGRIPPMYEFLHWASSMHNNKYDAINIVFYKVKKNLRKKYDEHNIMTIIMSNS